MATVLDLEQMSTDDKLRALEAIWTDLSQSQMDVPAPQWHHDTLQAREQAIKEGHATFSTWPDAKKRLRDRTQ